MPEEGKSGVPWGWTPPKAEPRQVGAVLVFDEGVTEADAQAILSKLQFVRVKAVRSFNPDHGEPVFYVP